MQGLSLTDKIQSSRSGRASPSPTSVVPKSATHHSVSVSSHHLANLSHISSMVEVSQTDEPGSSRQSPHQWVSDPPSQVHTITREELVAISKENIQVLLTIKEEITAAIRDNNRMMLALKEEVALIGGRMTRLEVMVGQLSPPEAVPYHAGPPVPSSSVTPASNVIPLPLTAHFPALTSPSQ